MFLTMASTCAVLMATYVNHNRRVMAYVAGQTSDLLAISQLAQAHIPPDADRKQALDEYLKALKSAGLSVVNLASPTGEIVASTIPERLGTKIKISKRRAVSKQDPIKISARFPDIDIDTTVEQRAFTVEFPIVQGDKVIGYAQVQGIGDEVGDLLVRNYRERLILILATMLTGMFAVVYLATRFTRPINTLVAGAQQVARGNLDVALPVKGTDEMGRLAETFNQMVERLGENRRLQDRLNAAEKTSLLGRFASIVAHEVRNSLNFINLSIDQIRAKHSDGDQRTARELRRSLSNIKDEIIRLNRLVNDFLAAGRQTPPEFSSCDLRATVEQAVALVEKQAQQQRITISTDLPADCPNLEADAGQMKTCFLNVLTNAIQAMPRGGEISISARCISENGAPGMLQLRFSDTGPGIPPEDREKVFAPFFSTKATGFGLGLAITKKIVEDHGGMIHVADTETRGTTMVIELPLARTSASPPTVAETSRVA